MAALVDTNVVLDMLAKREPWYRSVSNLLFLCAQGKCQLALSGSTITDIYYLINKYGDKNTENSREVIRKLLEFFSVVEVGFPECCIALTSKVADYEDAVLAEAARRAKLDCIITRNKSGFSHATIPVFSPDEYLHGLVVSKQ